MAKRRKKAGIPQKVWILIALLVFAAAAVARVLRDVRDTWPYIAIAAVLFSISVLAIEVLPVVMLRKKIRAATHVHRAALIRKRAQLLQPDAYGSFPTQRWEKEIAYFLRTQVLPHARGKQEALLATDPGRWIQFLENEISASPSGGMELSEFRMDMSPSEFEAFCADELKRAGWSARVTGSGSDQGVDIVAERNGLRLVVQCKKYSRPVGNKAIQEIVAAKIHEGADFAAVVSNNAYTLSAKQLAETTGTYLWHYSDLRRSTVLFGQGESA